MRLRLLPVTVLLSLLSTFCSTERSPNYAYNTENVRTGVITIRQAKVSEFPINRVRKAVIKLTSPTSPTVATKSRGVPTQNNIKVAPKPTYSTISYSSPSTYSFSPMLGYHQPPQYSTAYQTPIVTYQPQGNYYQSPYSQYGQSNTNTNGNSYYSSQQHQQSPQIYAYLATFPEAEKPKQQQQQPVKSQYSFKPPTLKQNPTKFRASQQVTHTRTGSKKVVVAKVKKLPVTKVTVPTDPTVIYHTYNNQPAAGVGLTSYSTIPVQQVQPISQQYTSYSHQQPQQQVVQVAASAVPSQLPYVNYYYANPETLYPIQAYSGTGTTRAATQQSSPGFVTAAASKVRPSGLGVSYSPVVPGIASYNFQGFGVQYGY